MNLKAKFFGILHKINWMDIYFIVVTIAYGLWKTKVYITRFL